MAGYGRDLRMAFFNAPDEGRHKIYKIVDLGKKAPERFAVLKWTTLSTVQLVGKFDNKADAVRLFNERIKRDDDLEPKFSLIAERIYD